MQSKDPDPQKLRKAHSVRVRPRNERPADAHAQAPGFPRLIQDTRNHGGTNPMVSELTFKGRGGGSRAAPEHARALRPDRETFRGCFASLAVTSPPVTCSSGCCWIARPSGHWTACAFFVARRASSPNMYDGR